MQEAPATEVPAAKAREHLIACVEEMVAGLRHVRQRKNALLYVRGLIERGGRKSPQPTLLRLGENAARYESVQQFLADSPWDAGLLVHACAERVTAELGLAAWLVDDTGVVKDGHHSPRVKRQYSATLGKIGSCQITVSVHAVGERGTAPLGWALYLPEEWCANAPRRRKAKIPDEVSFQTKPQLAAALAANGSWSSGPSMNEPRRLLALQPPRRQRARDLRPRLPHSRAALPRSPAAGLTLPQAVLLLQPLLRCWDGRCRTCRQAVDLDQLVLFPRIEYQSTSRAGRPRARARLRPRPPRPPAPARRTAASTGTARPCRTSR
jgi:hypothetical protein